LRICVFRFDENRYAVGPAVVEFLFDVDFLTRGDDSATELLAMPGTARKSLAAALMTESAEPKCAMSALRRRGPMPGVRARSNSAERRSGAFGDGGMRAF
jgi:hypothetical protein